MLWIKALHIIAMVSWFAGLFYLPRLYVYHAMNTEQNILAQFKIMEHKLFYYITTPAGLLTIITGYGLIYTSAPITAWWIHFKLILVGTLVLFHIYCGFVLEKFKEDKNNHSHVFYRFLNEFPTLVLIAVVFLTILKPC